MLITNCRATCLLYQVIHIVITSLKLLITQIAVTDKIMQSKTSRNNMFLSTKMETCLALQNTPLLLQDSKRPFNDITKGRMQEIEHLIFSLRRPWPIPKFRYMVGASFERCKIPDSVWITWIHEIIFYYQTKLVSTWLSASRLVV